ncbi:DNA-processing protein DprA [Ferruginivarius sediminum]|uniref:DNA-protecting protein DprA n=1 Tax=Ferruginivarius sediminum TaxID=2661937 RepID=A0A369TBU8_9PROT|nr:DNA-processing protein DprA [Ferruginivarius sediminum]RDD62750.1 DNA-protecting protein DprA [Ferruginivarius sediminum]
MSNRIRPSLSRAETIDWLRLLRTQNVGPVTFRQLIGRFGTADAALDALPELARRGGRRGNIRICSRAAAERELRRLQDLGADILAIGTEGYPPRLAAIDDAPPLLFIRGHAQLLERPAVAIVGARNASANGRRMARELAHKLSEQGLTVTSGLARGIDAAAHAGSLNHGTCAVMAGGIDVVYPPEHQPLYDSIIEQGIAVSETAAGTEPQARHFPRRNRLISGLVVGVVVVEAALRSGSLITARLASEQGREVLAVPGSPQDPRSAGCNHLLKQGAAIVESAVDVLDALGPQLRADPAEPAGLEFGMSGVALEDLDENELARARAEVQELLAFTPVPVDEVIRECQLSPSVVTTVLLELELAGRCERHPGNRVALLQEDRLEAS